MFMTQSGKLFEGGGKDRNRTDVHGFAGRCITTLPPCHKKTVKLYLFNSIFACNLQHPNEIRHHFYRHLL